MVTIVSVLKSGGEYKTEHVWELYEGCKKFSFPYKFICISDDNNVPGHVPMQHNFPKWWGKIEMFNQNYDTEYVFYLDLDTVIIGDFIELMEYSGDFMMLEDFFFPKSYGSGIMYFKPSKVKHLYTKFLTDPKGFMEKHQRGGDQIFILQNMDSIDKIQKVFPNKVISYKEHCCHDRGGRNYKGLPNKGECIVEFHGQPRPFHFDKLKKFYKEVKDKYRSKNKICVVIGGASSWFEDWQNLMDILPDSLEFDVAVVNDHISTFDLAPISWAFTLHSEKLDNWVAQRKKPFKGNVVTMKRLDTKLNTSVYEFIDSKKSRGGGGSSGGYAVFNLLDYYGYNKIILVGIRMDDQKNTFRDEKIWKGFKSYYTPWTQHKNFLEPRVRSMSGWTADIFKKPTLEWLQG